MLNRIGDLLSPLINVIDLPGSMVRDVAAVRNPFDQVFDPLGSTNRTSGRDLLREYGAIGDEDTYSNAIGGAVAEAALDPLTYGTLGLSAIAKAGGLAKAAGKAANSGIRMASPGIADSIAKYAGKLEPQNLRPAIRERAYGATQKLDDAGNPDFLTSTARKIEASMAPKVDIMTRRPAGTLRNAIDHRGEIAQRLGLAKPVFRETTGIDDYNVETDPSQYSDMNEYEQAMARLYR